jgi:hypothetical protein
MVQVPVYVSAPGGGMELLGADNGQSSAYSPLPPPTQTSFILPLLGLPISVEKSTPCTRE